MKNYMIKPIGRIIFYKETPAIAVDETFRPALRELENFSHLNIFWWFDGCDNESARHNLQESHPYKYAPNIVGTFATRSPQRPNPIAYTVAEIVKINHEIGMIMLSHIDADENSPVIDLKPYTPSLDRVQFPQVPAWCSHWPKCLEESEDFDWENEFHF